MESPFGDLIVLVCILIWTARKVQPGSAIFPEQWIGYKVNTDREKKGDIHAEGESDQTCLLINWSGYQRKSSHVKTACLQSVSPEFVLDLRDEQPVSSNSLFHTRIRHLPAKHQFSLPSILRRQAV
jgi:hypothetical protein